MIKSKLNEKWIKVRSLRREDNNVLRNKLKKYNKGVI